ncbi:NACHT domain-containing protein [Streptomyces tropicalis]|uniref:NACHT domain-containing protein n=1 Tax=Streptomyces tropicalis TaxID=3034234 RepID=A0ABT6A6A1_9ACTN|nr:NACHT domain-containing protein [Streptomyces tropicalis]MDF3300178.1 hypothetical protein [Streptomyces tropicalis]
MNAGPDPQDHSVRAPDQADGERSISVGRDNSGISSTGDYAVNVLFAGGVSAEGALAELADRLVRAVRTGRPSVDEELAYKADLLANEVRARLQHEEEQLRLQDGSPLTVHWQPVPGTGPGSGEGIRGATGEDADAPPLHLAGQLDEIMAVHERAEPRSLMVLGREGSGKSVLALQFALNRLKARSRAGKAPVPVVFSLGSWNPSTTLRRWLTGRLKRDYPFLAEAGPSGKTWAAALVGANLVLPILDGFDEIAVGLHVRALKALNSSTLPLLVTSRPLEFEAATKATNVVPSAAAIELIDLKLDDSVAYLHKATGTPPSDGVDAAPQAGWAYVLSELSRRTQASANLAAVLTTPLMVTLARFVYESDSDPSELSDRDPSDLLNSKKLDTREALEKHLLDSYIRTAYDRSLPNEPEAEPEAEENRRWDPERAQHWLGYLAAHLTELETQDIEWWRLGATVKLRWRMLWVGVTVGIASGLVAGLVYGAESGLLYGPVNGLVVASLTGPTNGLAVGLTFGLMHGFVTKMDVGGPMFEPSLMEVTLQGWRENGTKARLRESFRPRVTRGLAGGLLFGLLWALGSAAFTALLGCPGSVIALTSGENLVGGIGLGFAMGLIAALGAGFETVIPREKLVNPSILLHTSRTTVLKQLLTIALVIGSGYGIVFGLASSAVAGLGAGWVAGSVIALGTGTMTAWGRWAVLARMWLPLTGRLPRDLDAFLQDAYERGVLRRVGAVYQFRHAQLRDRLGDVYQKRLEGSRPGPGSAHPPDGRKPAHHRPTDCTTARFPDGSRS